MPDKKTFLLAVYGTLKAAYGNHSCLGTNPKKRGELWITDYLIKTNGYYPAAICKEGYSIWAEVYEIDENALKTCDHLEGVSGDLFRRVTVKTMMFGDEPVYMYTQSHVGIRKGERWISTGVFEKPGGVIANVTAWMGDEQERQLLEMHGSVKQTKVGHEDPIEDTEKDDVVFDDVVFHKIKP